MQLCEYSDYSKFHLFSLALLLFVTLSQLLRRTVFHAIFFFCCGLIYQNIYATTDRGFLIRVHSTEGVSGKKWF